MNPLENDKIKEAVLKILTRVMDRPGFAVELNHLRREDRGKVNLKLTCRQNPNCNLTSPVKGAMIQLDREKSDERNLYFLADMIQFLDERMDPDSEAWGQ